MVKKDLFPEKINKFYLEQKKTFSVFKENYYFLKNNLKTKAFDFPDFNLILQFNPKRTFSAKAKVDKNSIAKRKCFLCKENIFPDQKQLIIYKDYVIQCNPFPIFEKHFTIVNKKHVLQAIFNNFIDLLNISEKLKDRHFVFYNGPETGASAPDHLHFQAAKVKSLPIESEYQKIKEKNGQIVFENKTIKIFAIKNYLRNFIAIEGKNKKEINEYFKIIYNSLAEVFKTKNEPKLNIICFNKKGAVTVFIFPRITHRPDFYYFTGKKQILLSPGTTDMGGLLLAVREEDFEKITRENLIDLYRQVCISDADFDNVVFLLKEKLKK